MNRETEERTIEIAKSNFRYDNLMKIRNKIDCGDHWKIQFSYIDADKSIKLTYILKK